MLKGAKIVFNRRASVIDCVVRNLTNSGACIHTQDAATMPNQFELCFGDLRTFRRCAVIWRTPDKLGVAFG